MCHFSEKGIILMRIMCESPLRGHICNSLPVISPLLIKIGELKSLGTGFLSELNVLNVNWPVVKLSLWHFTVLQATLHIAGACGLGQVVKARVERSIAADSRGRDNYVVVTTNTAGNGPTFPWRISGLGVHKHWCVPGHFKNIQFWSTQTQLETARLPTKNIQFWLL